MNDHSKSLFRKGTDLLGAPWIDLACRLTLGIIFLYAGLPKMAHPQIFLMESRAYQILPDVVLPLFSIFLPTLEVVLGLMLLAGVWTRATGGLLLGLLIVFIIAISKALAEGLDIECGCFTGEGHKVGMTILTRDIGMIILLIPIFMARRRLFCLTDD